MKYGKEVFFLFPVEIFSYSIKERKLYPKKIYVIGTGLIRSFYPEESIGKLMENTFGIEILRKREKREKHQCLPLERIDRKREVDSLVKESRS